MKKLVIYLIFASLLGLVTVSTALAGRPMDVHIEVDETFGNGDPFTAWGSAVDDGLVCSSGTVDELGGKVGPSNGTFRNLRADKLFNCDGGGTFKARLIVKLDIATGQTTASWRIFGGTGDYAGLKGNGSLVGIPVVHGVSILDIYDGRVH